MKYYLISNKAAEQLGVTGFRQGSREKGYLVNVGDLATASDSIREGAQEMTVMEALNFLNEL